MRYLKCVAGLMALVLLGGCATVSQQSFQKPTEQPFRRIALITIPEPPVYHATDWGNPGMMFGAVGGAVAGASVSAETKRFHELVSGKGLNSSAVLYETLEAQLTALGYEVVRADVAREKPFELLETYDGLADYKVDAILDVVIAPYGAGYSTVNLFDRKFRPDVRVRSKLVSQHTGKMLYSNVVMYGYHNPFMSAVDLDAPQRFYFDDFDTLVAHSDDAVEGIRAGVIAAAEHIAQALK